MGCELFQTHAHALISWFQNSSKYGPTVFRIHKTAVGTYISNNLHVKKLDCQTGEQGN